MEIIFKLQTIPFCNCYPYYSLRLIVTKYFTPIPQTRWFRPGHGLMLPKHNKQPTNGWTSHSPDRNPGENLQLNWRRHLHVQIRLWIRNSNCCTFRRHCSNCRCWTVQKMHIVFTQGLPFHYMWGCTCAELPLSSSCSFFGHRAAGRVWRMDQGQCRPARVAVEKYAGVTVILFLLFMQHITEMPPSPKDSPGLVCASP